MEYKTLQHIVLPVIFLLCVATMFIYYSPNDEAGVTIDPHRGCIASAYNATRYGSPLEDNLKYCENY